MFLLDIFTAVVWSITACIHVIILPCSIFDFNAVQSTVYITCRPPASATCLPISHAQSVVGERFVASRLSSMLSMNPCSSCVHVSSEMAMCILTLDRLTIPLSILIWTIILCSAKVFGELTVVPLLFVAVMALCLTTVSTKFTTAVIHLRHLFCGLQVPSRHPSPKAQNSRISRWTET